MASNLMQRPMSVLAVSTPAAVLAAGFGAGSGSGSGARFDVRHGAAVGTGPVSAPWARSLETPAVDADHSAHAQMTVRIEDAKGFPPRGPAPA